VLSGRGLCDGLITRPEETYRLWRIIVCDQETSKNEEAKARYQDVENTTTMGCKAAKTNNNKQDYVISAYKWLKFLLTQTKLPEDLPYYFVYVSNATRETLYKI
jgi:hypothetical protein